MLLFQSHLLTTFCLLWKSLGSPTVSPTVLKYTVSRDVLSELYNATDGWNWVRKENWLDGNPCTNGWFGVKCSLISNSDSSLEYTDVTSLLLMDNSLQHHLPTSLGLLSGIKSKFRFDGNSMSGTIPSELGILSKLADIFYLWGNTFEGTLPSQLGQLTALTKSFKISSNRLTGELPSQLGQLTGLQVEFRSVHNSFSGFLPSQLGQLTVLSGSFDVSTNQFCSTIPSQVSALEPQMTIDWGLTAENSFGTLCPVELLTSGPTSLPTSMPISPTISPTTLEFMLDRNRPDVKAISVFIIISIIIIGLLFLYLTYRVYDNYNWSKIDFIPDSRRLSARDSSIRSSFRDSLNGSPIDIEALLKETDRESNCAFIINALLAFVYFVFRTVDRCFGFMLLQIVYVLWRCGVVNEHYVHVADPHKEEKKKKKYKKDSDYSDSSDDDDDESGDKALERFMLSHDGDDEGDYDDETKPFVGGPLGTINEDGDEEEEEEEEDAKDERGARIDRQSGEMKRRKSVIKKVGKKGRGSLRQFQKASLGGFVNRLAYGEKVIPKARKKTVVAMEMGMMEPSVVVGMDASELEDVAPAPKVKSNTRYNF